MKQIGITYSAAMILAKLAGRKTQTRRVITPQPQQVTGYPAPFAKPFDGKRLWLWKYIDNGSEVGLYDGDKDRTQSCHPPRGTVGDHQYWQEAFDFGGFCGAGVNLRYKADQQIKFIPFTDFSDYDLGLIKAWKKPKTTEIYRGMPAIFMLRSMSRGLDEVTGLRVERVQEITEEGSIAEGCISEHEMPYDWWEGYDTSIRDRHGNATHQMFAKENWPTPPPNWEDVRTHKGSRGFNVTAKQWFQTLWNSINAKRGFSWESNPWVWVYETRAVK